MYLLVGAIVVILAAAGLTLFLLTRGSEPEAPAPGREPTVTAGAQVVTPAGTLFIEEAAVSETWPPDCVYGTDPMCNRAEAGYMVLVVWLNPGSATDERASDAILDAYGDVYVTDSAGERTNGFAGGLLSGRLLIAFTPNEDAHGFTLNWPGNDPITLDI